MTSPALSDGVNNVTHHAFEDTYRRILNNHAPLKQNKTTICRNDQPFMTNTMRKALCFVLWAYGVVVSMFDFHRSARGSNPGRGGKIS